MIKICGVKKINALFDLSKNKPKEKLTRKVMPLFHIKESEKSIERRVKSGIVKSENTTI